MNQERKDLARWAVNQIMIQGADEASVSLAGQRTVSVQVREGKIEKLQESVEQSLTLNIYADHRYSSHTTNDLGRDTLEKFIAEAVAGTRYLSPDQFRTLPDPRLFPKAASPELGICDPGFDSVQAKDRIRYAEAMEAVARSFDPSLRSATSDYSDFQRESVRITSNGFEGENRSTTFSGSVEVTVADPKGGLPEDYAYAQTRFRKDMPDPETIGQEAAKRAVAKIGQRKIASGRYPMVVENRVGANLVGLLVGPMQARAIQQKSSFLDGMLGKPVAHTRLTLVDDPLVVHGLGSRPYDGEGLAAQKRVMIDQGILQQYYVDWYYGRKLGIEPTTGSASNLVVGPGAESSQALLEKLAPGILVQGFIGGNSNPLTGDFSFGIVGMWVENGRIVHPVHEMNISGNTLELWKRLSGVGNDPNPYSSWRVPSLWFEDVQFSGL